MPGTGAPVTSGSALAGFPATFWWVWAATLVNRLGGFVVAFLALYLTLERHSSASFVGLVVALYGLGGVLGNLIGGVLSDRLGRRITLLVAQLATAVTTVALGHSTAPVVIAVVAFSVGMASNASRPAISAIIADIIPAPDRARAFALNFWAINLGFGVSAALAGLVAERSFLPLFYGEAAASLLTAAAVLIRVPETRPAAESSGIEGSPAPPETHRYSIASVLRDRPFMSLVVITWAVCLTYHQANSTLAFRMGRHGFTPAQYGLTVGVNGFVVVLLQLPVTRLVQGVDRRLVLMLAAMLTGGGFGLVAFAYTAPAYAGTVVVWTLGEILLAPAAMAVASEMAPVAARGRYLGIYALAYAGAAFAGPAFGGALTDWYGDGAVWAGCALVGVLAAVGYGRLAGAGTPAVALTSGSPGA
ncbi:MFS transporter [Jatrophihabitans sp.]|uniref:MFS transporter n=1 Tax=Jatrophihabitans sp. TaxID=1932789 RepID=UPI002D1DBC01|nr:MFS transporter [Jatrophihabitans sp.]